MTHDRFDLPDPSSPSEMELEKTPPVGPTPPGSGLPPWLPWAGVAALLVVVVAAFILLRQGGDPAVDDGAPGMAAVEEGTDPAMASGPLGPDVEPIDLPPLEATDAIVRSLVQALSTHPRVAAWLSTDQLIRNFTVVVENVATGASPARHLTVFRPVDPFEAAARESTLLVHPRSFARYTTIAAGVESIDPDGAARLYAMLKPRIEDAHRELGHRESFDVMLERAILVLLHTPVPGDQVRIVERGGIYEYADPAFEQLSEVQKQFLRMGPANVRTVQAHLQAIALALGIPADRLGH